MSTAVRVGKVIGVLGMLQFVEQGVVEPDTEVIVFTCLFERLEGFKEGVRPIDMKMYSNNDSRGVVPSTLVVFDTDEEGTVTYVAPLSFPDVR